MWCRYIFVSTYNAMHSWSFEPLSRSIQTYMRMGGSECEYMTYKDNVLCLHGYGTFKHNQCIPCVVQTGHVGTCLCLV